MHLTSNTRIDRTHQVTDSGRMMHSNSSIGVIGTFHYVPLHSSPAGQKYGRTVGSMEKTDSFAGRLARLPLWPGMTDEQVRYVIHTVKAFQA